MARDRTRERKRHAELWKEADTWRVGRDDVKTQIQGHPFRADVDLAELDERKRPGPTWIGRTQVLSRSHVALLSRRVCYPGKTLLIAVHLIDAEPTPLAGKVVSCEYDTDGLYRTVVEFAALPREPAALLWFKHRGR